MSRATPVQGDARCLPLADESVDLIITSPPYFALRSYRDNGEHYEGQVGSEPTPKAFLEALWAVTAECWRVLKPTGSCFVNLGDKRAGTGGANGNTGLGFADDKTTAADNRSGPRNQGFGGPVGGGFRGVRPKSKMLLPHRFAIGCEDGLADPDGVGWIVRQDIVWSKPNGLPESVTDRVRDSHEMWFHLTKQGRYFSAVDEIREPHTARAIEQQAIDSRSGGASRSGWRGVDGQGVRERSFTGLHALGSLPGSVWTIASEPLTIPDAVKAHYDLPDHFAAFPSEWPRRLILGWSPSGVCVACGEGRRPVHERGALVGTDRGGNHKRGMVGGDPGYKGNPGIPGMSYEKRLTGYACACPDTSAPTRPAVVIDPFGGTGTVAGVARQLGRTGVSFDLSMDYSRLAQWFLRDGRRFAKTSSRTDRERQGVLL